MQIEKLDSEKANLLPPKPEDNNTNNNVSIKKKTRNRSERKSPASSSSGTQRRKTHKSNAERRSEVPEHRTESIPLQNEKSFFDRFWGECDQTKCKKTEDTFSCVSCALKKIASSEYACIGCVIVLFTVSIVLAFMVICKTTLVAGEDDWATVDSDKLKKRIEKVKEGNRIKEELSGDRGTFGGRSRWRDRAIPISALTADAEFGPSYGESNSLDQASENKVSRYLSSILDADKISEFQTSEKLREFYRKLLQADVQIQNLKKSDDNAAHVEDFKSNRRKRSLRSRYIKKHRPEETTNEKKSNRTEDLAPFNKKLRDHMHRLKRHGNHSEEPMGFVIEKKKLIVQYKPSNSKKVPKCSHAPKDSHTHEKQLKHPFYKNTQRLDEWLDTFLSKNIPEVISDPFGLNELFNYEKNKCKHPSIHEFKDTNTVDQVTQSKSSKINTDMEDKIILNAAKQRDDGNENPEVSVSDIVKLIKPESTTDLGHRLSEFDKMFSGNIKASKNSPTTANYDFQMSVSTVTKPDSKNSDNPLGLSLLERVPNIRRLMQLNGDDDELGYGDFKEVLNDNRDNNDEFGKSSKDRKKRMEETPPHMDEFKHANPSSVNNPNWKGPMPLYPDELSAMVKQDSDNRNDEFLKPAKDISAEINVSGIDLNDVENYQDYLDKKYDNLGVAQMAQAYSDYGVLDGKKESEKSGKHSAIEDKSQRIKMSVNKLFSRMKKDPGDEHLTKPISEGLRFEIRPSSSPAKENTHDMSKMMQDHHKIGDLLKPAGSNNALVSKGHMNSPKIDSSDTEQGFLSKIMKNHFKIVEVGKNQGNNVKNVDETFDKKYDWSPDSSWLFHRNDNRRSLLSVEMPTDKRYLDKDESTTITANPKYYNKPTKNNNSVDVINDSYYKPNKIEMKPNLYIKKIENTTRLSSDNVTLTERRFTTSNTYNVSALQFSAAKEDTQNEFDDFLSIYSLPLILYFNDEDFNEIDNANEEQNQTIRKRDVINVTDVSSKEQNKNYTDPLNATDESGLKNISINETASRNQANLSDFFMAMSSLFAALDGVDIPSPKDDTSSDIIELLIKPKNTSKMNTTLNIFYPLYDSEWFENIGHRTRVLLSVDDNSNHTNEKMVPGFNYTEMKVDTESNITNKLDSNITKSVTDNNIVNKTKDVILKENKTLVKRNADDSNLIFWNDMYDDEYGVETDRSDDAVRDKHFAKGNGFLRKSGRWVQDKLKKFANNIRGSSASPRVTMNNRIAREAVLLNGMETYPASILYRKTKRQAKGLPEETFDNQKSVFAAMTKNMKEVCKKAAEAVQQTKNINVRENSKAESVSTSLMQQLLRLMNDLVEYQVQQKTCSKLPPDLQSFLEWLTAPEDESKSLADIETSSPDSNPYVSSNNLHTPSSNVRSSDYQSMYTTEKSKAQHLDALKNVQDLLELYHGMNEEEKSKMVGIESYLDSQLNYLNKQVYGYSDNDIFTDFDSAKGRFKRFLADAKRRRLKRKLHRFINIPGVNYISTTPSYYESITITQHTKQSASGNDVSTIDEKEHNDKDSKKGIGKRNLQDVYYRAVANAKKHTTVNTLMRTNSNYKVENINKFRTNKGIPQK